MNKKTTLAIALIALVLPRLQAEATNQPPPLTVAVLNFESSDERLQGKAAEASTLLGAQLSTNGAVWTIERAEIDKVLGEQTMALSGLNDPATAAKTGKLLGAKVLVTGRLIPTGNSLVVVAKIISTETSRVFGETVTVTKEESLEKPSAELADKVAKLLAAQQSAFTPTFTTTEERIAALKKIIEGKKLPSVQVSIAEVDLRHVAIDPAVETEFQKVLQELGFEVIDPSLSPKQADILITGQAFSETGARRGQLVSARARAEIKAVRRSDGKLLDADRETAVAVDIAEATAGKTALQDAALILIERAVPKLVNP
jgi:phenylpyruvate tautomerase PptA (4-oxalocrotonate tautomerase family)